MPHLFKPFYTQLSADSREVVIEPMFSVNIDASGWHARGAYRIITEGTGVGMLYFEGNQWHYEGSGLNEIQQEELAYYIRFHDDKAA